VVDLQARADGFGRIVGAIFLRRPGRQPPDELFFGDVEQQDFTESLAAARRAWYRPAPLGGGAWKAVENRPCFRLGLRQLLLMRLRITVSGTSLPASMYFLAWTPSGVCAFTAARRCRPW